VCSDASTTQAALLRGRGDLKNARLHFQADFPDTSSIHLRAKPIERLGFRIKRNAEKLSVKAVGDEYLDSDTAIVGYNTQQERRKQPLYKIAPGDYIKSVNRAETFHEMVRELHRSAANESELKLSLERELADVLESTRAHRVPPLRPSTCLPFLAPPTPAAVAAALGAAEDMMDEEGEVPPQSTRVHRVPLLRPSPSLPFLVPPTPGAAAAAAAAVAALGAVADMEDEAVSSARLSARLSVHFTTDVGEFSFVDAFGRRSAEEQRRGDDEAGEELPPLPCNSSAARPPLDELPPLPRGGSCASQWSVAVLCEGSASPTSPALPPLIPQTPQAADAASPVRHRGMQRNATAPGRLPLPASGLRRGATSPRGDSEEVPPAFSEELGPFRASSAAPGEAAALKRPPRSSSSSSALRAVKQKLLRRPPPSSQASTREPTPDQGARPTPPISVMAAAAARPLQMWQGAFPRRAPSLE